ncbi:family 2A encapsulin nanocompartment cargo protein cysteine desulfurase [Magnetospirillum sp. 15-1]|uniref:family 2A encapsulin nanocompartment cargo protein cysteine desulfurase n=1 Tax=Magnetospirillum sp. 15-1 TaxID=1979370 RepID=UPI000BBBA84B|nr:family 2A encapsulin nanocompartment cargo protein cysteine desulfurase [Magnetospirillum sp. 15-1]
MTQPLSLDLPSSPTPAAPPAGDWDEPATGSAGAPDARLIAQMANALFNTQPGHSQPSIGVAPPSLPPVEAPAEVDFGNVANLLGGIVRLVPPEHGVEPAPPPLPPDPSLPASPLLAIELRPELIPDLRGTGAHGGAFDAHTVRRDFPILNQQVHGKPLIWLDNAATTQKPRQVIERLKRYYEFENSNIHRAAHTLAARSTDAYEAAREKTRRFLNAGSTEEIVFVRGATEGINLIAKAWGERNVREGDEIVVTWLEHHANIVPWQQLAARVGAKLRVAPVDDSGQIILEEYEKLLNPRTRLVSLTQVSNALGTITPAAEMTAMAHRHGATVLVDGAQAVSHMAVDVQALGCDFYVFSGHKVFAPTGIGAVYGRKAVLDQMPPWQGGGNMIADVTFEKTVFQPAPARFEAGTGNIADAVGLGAAIDYVEAIGLHIIDAWEHQLLDYGTQGLLTIPGLRLIGTAREKAGVLSFVIDGCRTEDIGKALNSEGIAVRSGHHCAQPILRRFGVEATVRPSLAFYNTFEDLDALVNALRRFQSGHGGRGA